MPAEFLVQSVPAPSDRYPAETDYLHLLEHFARYSERGWKKSYLGRADLGYFGDPSHKENGMRSMGNYIFVTSLLASNPSYNPQVSGCDRQLLLDRAKCALGYMTGSHVTGEIRTGSGGKWGGNWQSAWWATKMALGAKLVWSALSAAEQAAVERVVVYEANQHLDRIVPSGLYGDTKAEENAWDTEILATAIALFPAHAQRDRWQEKLIEFCLNTLSVAQDHTSDACVDGKQLKDHVYTVNLHSDYTIENHGACHFCYVASPLVSIAWSYYALLSSQQPVPDALFHHVQDLWEQVKPTFLASRFAYIGGKDWARYTYGLYFIVPALVMLQHRYADADARAIEIARLKTLADEHQDNSDGSFFGKRVTRQQMFGQNAKYETDCYANLGLAYLLHQLLGAPQPATPPATLQQRLQGRRISPESGTCYVKTSSLFASFSWRTLTQPYPIALFIPAGMDDAAEWAANNLLGRVEVGGMTHAVAIRTMKAIGSGFRVEGTISYRSTKRELFAHQLRYEVMPDQNLAIVESKFVAKSQIWVQRQEGLRLAIANDRFNGYSRQFYWEGGSAMVTFNPNLDRAAGGRLSRLRRKLAKRFDREAVNWQMGDRWVNVDDRLGVVQLQPQAEPFNLRQEPGRNTESQCLHYDLLNCPKLSLRPTRHPAGEVLLHTRFALLAGTSAETAALASGQPHADLLTHF